MRWSVVTISDIVSRIVVSVSVSVSRIVIGICVRVSVGARIRDVVTGAAYCGLLIIIILRLLRINLHKVKEIAKNKDSTVYDFLPHHRRCCTHIHHRQRLRRRVCDVSILVE